MKLIDVEMQDVELIGAARDLVEHQHVIGDDIADVGLEPQGAGNARHKLGRRDRIAAREQRHVVPELDQFLGEVVNDAFGPAVGFRGNAFNQRRNLGNTHRTGPWVHEPPNGKALGVTLQRFAAQ